MAWLCYTTCDSGQRFAVPEESVVITFDPVVIGVVLANIEHTAQNVIPDSEKIADALLEQDVNAEAVGQLRAHASELASSAARISRRSKYTAEAFLCAPNGFRGLVHTIARCDWKEMVAYTRGVAS
jgi:hypothetical protein